MIPAFLIDAVIGLALALFCSPVIAEILFYLGFTGPSPPDRFGAAQAFLISAPFFAAAAGISFALRDRILKSGA